MKRYTLTTMHHSGFRRVVERSRWRSQRLLILGYHSLSQSDEHAWNPELYLAPQRFRTHLETIAEGGFEVLGLAEGLARLYAGCLPPRAVCLTFDDGTVDFHRIAQPLLREFNFPATVYLSTYYCVNNTPVFPPALAYVLWSGRGRSEVPFPDAIGQSKPMRLTTVAGREAARRELLTFAEQRGLSGVAKNDLLAEVAAAVGYDFEAMLRGRLHHLMNAEEVAHIAREGVDVQLHTHRHRSPLDRDRYRREIDDNRGIIEQLTGRRPNHYCYPSGHTHPQFERWLIEEGVESAATCRIGIASARSHPWLLPRLVCGSRIDRMELSSWLSGTAALLLRRPTPPPEWEPPSSTTVPGDSSNEL